jgi:putative cell wall-binding protein
VVGGSSAVADSVMQEAGRYADRVVRLMGGNRYATGAAIADKFWSSPKTVFLASGQSYPDAVSGGALAAHRGAPVALSRPGGIPRAVRDLLRNLDPSRVVLLGGEGALSGDVQAKAGALLPDATVTRLAGADRYGTSAAATRRGWNSADKVYFATGFDFPDALAGVPAAAKRQAPLLLTKPRCLPQPVYRVVADLDPAKRFLLGGASVLVDGAPTRKCGS